MALSFLTILGGIVALAAFAVYFYGIPPQVKRNFEQTVHQYKEEARQKTGSARQDVSAGKSTGSSPASYRAPIATADDSSVHHLAAKLRPATGQTSDGPLGGSGSLGNQSSSIEDTTQGYERIPTVPSGANPNRAL